MATAVEMPELAKSMEEGIVVSWEFEEGERIHEGDIIAQVETDKGIMDLEAYDDGILLYRGVEEGRAVPVGDLMAIIGKHDDEISDVLSQYGVEGHSSEEHAKGILEFESPAISLASYDGPVAGYVYILINPSYDAELIKIGKTKRSPEERAKELSKSTGVPAEFMVAYRAFVPNCDQIERTVHSRLARYRVNNDREFFEVPLKDAISVVTQAVLEQVFPDES